MIQNNALYYYKGKKTIYAQKVFSRVKRDVN